MPPFLEVLAAACFASSSRGRPRGRGDGLSSFHSVVTGPFTISTLMVCTRKLSICGTPIFRFQWL